MRKFMALCALLSLISCPPQVEARRVLSVDSTYATADVTITTTADTVVATSDVVTMPRETGMVCIQCSGNVTTSADSATYVVNINRGTTAAGTDVGTDVAKTVKVTAGGTEEFFRKACEARSSVNNVQYNCSIVLASASSTSTVNESTITIEVLE